MSPGLRSILSILPLVVFWWVERTHGMRAGIVAAMVLAVVELAITWLLERRVHRMTLFAVGLVAVLGGLSLSSDDPALFLLSPAIGDWIFAAVLILGSLRGDGVLLTLLREQDPTLDLHPLEEAFFRGVGARFAVNLLLHALAVCWAATASREIWLFVSGPLQLGQLGVQLAGEVGWGRLVIGPRVDAALAAERAP